MSVFRVQTCCIGHHYRVPQPCPSWDGVRRLVARISSFSTQCCSASPDGQHSVSSMLFVFSFHCGAAGGMTSEGCSGSAPGGSPLSHGVFFPALALPCPLGMVCQLTREKVHRPLAPSVFSMWDRSVVIPRRALHTSPSAFWPFGHLSGLTLFYSIFSGDAFLRAILCCFSFPVMHAVHSPPFCLLFQKEKGKCARTKTSQYRRPSGIPARA